MNASFTVECSGELLSTLFARFSEVKRAKLRQWLHNGGVTVNGAATTNPRQVVAVGDSITLCAARPVQHEDGDFPAGMRILFEDPSLIVIEKPSGLLSIATETEKERTAYALLTDYVRRKSRQRGERVWIVHRLDRETSGVMVFAKSQGVQQKLQSQWDRVEKRYLAVVEQGPDLDVGTWRSALDESHEYRVFSTTPQGEQTREAVTHYRVIHRQGPWCLLELNPETGRRNQLRVHLAEAGFPIIGDRKYQSPVNPARRLGLHAESLQFPHPETDELLQFTASWPQELARLVTRPS